MRLNQIRALRWFLRIAVCLALPLAAFGVTSLASASSTGPRQRAPSLDTARTENRSNRGVSPLLRKHFRVFRSHRSIAAHDAAAGAPRSLQRFADGTLPDLFMGVVSADNFAEVSVNPSFTAWLAPSAGGVCIASTDVGYAGGFSCAPVASAVNTGVTLVATSPTGFVTMFGLVPDGNPTVSLQTGNGATDVVPVVSNVYEATSSSGFTAMTIRNGAGDVETQPLGGQ
jgi:hypothetical protein